MSRSEFLFIVLLSVCLSIIGCQTSTPADTSQDQTTQVKALRPLGVIGTTEPVVIYPQKIVYPARIDTGATTSSIDARDVVFFERDRHKWVRFFIVDRPENKRYEVELPVARTTNITRHGQDPETRPVVELTISMGSVVLVREFTLADRENFEFPMLIGRNVLQGQAVVDVALSNTLKVEFANE